MIRFDPKMRVLVAIEPCDFRNGIDGLAHVCQEILQADPRSGHIFLFRNRARTAVKLLFYDGLGFWLCLRRLSSGTYKWWPRAKRPGERQIAAAVTDLAFLLGNGLPHGAPATSWQRLTRADDKDVEDQGHPR